VKYLTIIIILAIFAPIAANADTATLSPTDDSYVWMALPSTNFGEEEILAIGFYEGFINSLLKFDLSPYSGATVNSAYLRLYIYDSEEPFPPDNVFICRNIADWDELTVTWNNKPSGEDITYTDPSSHGWWVIDVTGWVDGFVNGSYENFGFQLAKASFTDVTFYMRSKEYSSDDPELILDYTPVGGVESASLGEIKTAFK
jgi:hypothetical protein